MRQRQSIPVRIYRNFLVVAEGQIGDVSERQNFILDTGTAPSIIDAGVVRKLGLGTIPSAFRAIGAIIPSHAATLPELDLGPIRAESLPVLVQDLSGFERELGIPIAGLIGMDVLSKSSFRLDYNKRKIEFGDIDISHEGVPVHFDADAGIAVAEATIEGKPARMLVDTGADGVMLLGGNFAKDERLSVRNTSQTGTSLIEHGMHVQVSSATDVFLGGQHFGIDKVVVVPERGDPAFDGLLGVRAFGFRALSYDQESATIYLGK